MNEHTDYSHLSAENKARLDAATQNIKDTVNENKGVVLREGTKFVVGNAAGMSASAVVQVLIKSNVIPVNRRGKIILAIGSYVIGSLVGAKCSDHVEEQIDAVFDFVGGVQKAIQNKSESN